jgi:hypothetical protein
MKKTKLTYADIVALQFIVKMFQEDHPLAQKDSMHFERLRIKLIVMMAEMEYLKNRENA